MCFLWSVVCECKIRGHQLVGCGGMCTHTHNKIRLLRGAGCLKKMGGGSVTACFAETKEWNRIGWSKYGSYNQ